MVIRNFENKYSLFLVIKLRETRLKPGISKKAVEEGIVR